MMQNSQKIVYFGISSVKYHFERKSLFGFRLTFHQKWNIYWWHRPSKAIIEPIFHHFCKNSPKNGKIWPILNSFLVNLPFKTRFGTLRLQNPKNHKYGKTTSWKSQELIFTYIKLPRRSLDSIGALERTFKKVYFLPKIH